MRKKETKINERKSKRDLSFGLFSRHISPFTIHNLLFHTEKIYKNVFLSNKYMYDNILKKIQAT